jgi:hypothetical protein
MWLEKRLKPKTPREVKEELERQRKEKQKKGH